MLFIDFEYDGDTGEIRTDAWLAVKAKVATGQYAAGPGCDSCVYADFETERICTHSDTTDEEIDAACYDALPCRFYQRIKVVTKLASD